MTDDVPAQTVEAVLAGMAARGVDVAAIRCQAGLPPEPPTLDTRWPWMVFGVAWEQCLRQFPSPMTPAEVGLLVPFGAIGMIDYLAGSAETIGGALRSLVAHIQSVAAQPTISLVEVKDEVRFGVDVTSMPMGWITEEFTLAMALKSLRYVAAAPLPILDVCVTRADPAPGALSATFDAPVRFDRPIGALRFLPAVLSVPLRTADPQLHRAMDLLPRGEADAAAMARALGMSERTMHRRLHERQTSWRAVLDAFRCEAQRSGSAGDPRRGATLF